MTRLTLLAALGRNRVIGADSAMPWHLPEDLRHFKAVTMGHPIIMGRRTFDSIGAPLPGRRSIVLTNDRSWHHAGAESAHSFDEALALTAGDDEAFVVGGGEIYRIALPHAHRMLLTHIDAETAGDTTFPAWDEHEWVETDRQQHDGFAFVTYARRGSPDPAATG